MIGTRIVIKRGSKDDGERPFWISFSDLMTALMVVFLLVMSVALLAVTKDVSESQRKAAERRKDIKELVSQLDVAAQSFTNVNVNQDEQNDYQNPFIDFGPLATFDVGKSQLKDSTKSVLRAYIMKLLSVANTEKGKKWFKQIVVEGYTDNTGTYLNNLDLSLRRSQRLVCVLLDELKPEDAALSAMQKEQVRKLFLVGGYSSNSAKSDDALSRRIELKLKFWEISDAERKDSMSQVDYTTPIGSCALGNE
jgi:outer membrane protein OmpA-like peptidoglycan-associated protein